MTRPGSPASHGRPAGRVRERGETLIEVLATVVLMGLGFSAVIGALYTVSATANVNQRRTQVANMIQIWAEDVQQPLIPTPSVTSPGFSPYLYVDCAVSQYQPPAGLIPSPWTATYTVRYLTGFTGATPNYTSNVNTCYSSGDKGIQEITLKVDTGPSKDRVVETLVLVKRNPKCPTNFDNADLGPC